MTAKDKKSLQYLAILLVIAGAIFLYLYRSSSVTTSADTGKKDKGKQTQSKGIKDAKINIDELAPEGGEAVGQKNIFQYRQKPLPPAPTLKPIANATPPPTPPPPTSVSSTPYVAPPPPFKNFKFDGLSTSGTAKSPKMLASLTDGTNTYQVTVGECIMGQYCVRSLTDSLIEIEDLQLKQRKTFPKTPPQQ